MIGNDCSYRSDHLEIQIDKRIQELRVKYWIQYRLWYRKNPKLWDPVASENFEYLQIFTWSWYYKGGTVKVTSFWGKETQNPLIFTTNTKTFTSDFTPTTYHHITRILHTIFVKVWKIFLKFPSNFHSNTVFFR